MAPSKAVGSSFDLMLKLFRVVISSPVTILKPTAISSAYVNMVEMTC